MIIRSIRLKNIKSYGDGPNSDGVTIEFQPGINRIAGKNGHGKSTLIESLGYALFLTNPVFEENFDVATYLLRSGKKAGEIDVTFDHEGHSYRLERGLGTQNKRRAKAILLDDGSTEAEGDKEMSAFLCRLFGFPLEGRCSELFSKLVGVRQGRLTLPFDSKSADARRHFEPLLDVEIFRLCFDKLKPALDRFDDLKRNQEDLRVAATERIEERKDSPEQVKRVQQEADALEKMVADARKIKETADQQRQAQETKEKAFQTAQKELDATTNALKLASQKKEHDQQRLNDSKRARDIVAANQSAHDAYTRAEAALARLQQQQTEKSRLERLLAEQSNLKTEWQGKADAARQQARTFAEQKAEKSGVAGQLRAQILDEENALARTKATFDDFAAT